MGVSIYPEDIAKAVSFLASSRASKTTGGALRGKLSNILDVIGISVNLRQNVVLEHGILRPASFEIGWIFPDFGFKVNFLGIE